MRKFGVLLLVLSALTLSAGAASSAEMSFGLLGGMAIPTGDYGDSFDPGFSGGVTGDLWVKPTYSFGADIIGNFHGGSDEFEALQGPGADISATMIQFGLHGKWLPPMQSSARPWIQYGAAMYNIQAKDEGPNSFDNSDTKAGIHGGIGVDFAAGAAMRLGVGGMYHYVFNAIETPTEDKAASYFGVAATLTFLTGGTTMAGSE